MKLLSVDQQDINFELIPPLCKQRSMEFIHTDTLRYRDYEPTKSRFMKSLH